jgi:hypothetical protein
MDYINSLDLTSCFSKILYNISQNTSVKLSDLCEIFDSHFIKYNIPLYTMDFFKGNKIKNEKIKFDNIFFSNVLKKLHEKLEKEFGKKFIKIVTKSFLDLTKKQTSYCIYPKRNETKCPNKCTQGSEFCSNHSKSPWALNYNANESELAKKIKEKAINNNVKPIRNLIYRVWIIPGSNIIVESPDNLKIKGYIDLNGNVKYEII